MSDVFLFNKGEDVSLLSGANSQCWKMQRFLQAHPVFCFHLILLLNFSPGAFREYFSATSLLTSLVNKTDLKFTVQNFVKLIKIALQ